MGFGVERVGGHSFHKDGGVDVVAWPNVSEFPFLMAVQAKHHQSPQRKTGPSAVRELLGVVQGGPFNIGVLVTNTTFTPDAVWVAEHHPLLMRLRDIYAIKRWLQNGFLDEYDWCKIPEQIHICPGVVIQLPKSRRLLL